MNESWRTIEWVMSHAWTSHFTHMNESRHTHEWVISHSWMSHVPHMNESFRTYEWVLSHSWVISHAPMSHITQMNESCHTYEWVLSRSRTSHVPHTIADERLIQQHAVPHQKVPAVPRDIWALHSVRQPEHRNKVDVAKFSRHLFERVVKLPDHCTQGLHTPTLHHTATLCDTLQRTFLSASSSSLTTLNSAGGAPSNTCIVSCMHMGWLRLVGSIKLYVSFAKEPYKRDNTLQKRPRILSILLTVATPHPTQMRAAHQTKDSSAGVGGEYMQGFTGM